MQQTRTIQLKENIQLNKSILRVIQDKISDSKNNILIYKYKFLEYISGGNFGKVYKGINLQTNKFVAIKIIDIYLLFRSNKSQYAQKKIMKYLETQQTLMRKCRSAHVVKLYDAYENSHTKIFVMEYCNNGNLHQYLIKHKALQENDAVAITKQIILGITTLHINGILHRDLKPQNILIHNGVFKISDFGLSTQFIMSQNLEVKRIITIAGTKMTMAPEVLARQPAGLNADIYSIGMMFFMMTYYKYQHKELSINQRYTRVGQARSNNFSYQTINNQKLSKQAGDFLRKTLQQKPNQRINWEQTLSHSIFNRKFVNLPSFCLPIRQDYFYNLSNQLKNIDYIQNQNLKPLKSINIELNLQQSKGLSDQDISSIINNNYIECRKTQYFYNKLLLPIKKNKLLDQTNIKYIELINLIIIRCSNNIEAAIQNIKSKCTQSIGEAFEQQIIQLRNKINELKQQYQEILRFLQSKWLRVIKENLKKITSYSQLSLKRKYLKQKQNVDYQKEQQINYTYEAYILNYVNSLSENVIFKQKIKPIFLGYRQINVLTFEKISTKGFIQSINQIIDFHRKK